MEKLENADYKHVFRNCNFDVFHDHNPPHFHARYGDYRASIAIETLAVKDGELPPRILGLVLEWAVEHKNELLVNWNTLKETGQFTEIKPLI